MVLIWSSTLRRCMAKSTIEPPSGFKAFRQGKYCNYLALRVIKDFIFLIYGLWALENRLNHIFRKALLPNYRWRHTSRWLKIFFLQKSSCYISIDSFFLCWVIFNKQPYPQNVRYRCYRAKGTVLLLGAENHQNYFFHRFSFFFFFLFFLLEENQIAEGMV